MKENWTPIGTMVFCNLKRNDNFEKDCRHVFVICYLSIIVRPRRPINSEVQLPCTSILSSNDISQSRSTQQKKTPFNLKTVLYFCWGAILNSVYSCKHFGFDRVPVIEIYKFFFLSFTKDCVTSQQTHPKCESCQ